MAEITQTLKTLTKKQYKDGEVIKEWLSTVDSGERIIRKIIAHYEDDGSFGWRCVEEYAKETE